MTSPLPTTVPPSSSPPSPNSFKHRISSLNLFHQNKKPQTFLGKHCQPYHEYVHRLVEAGWENLRELDMYLNEAPTTQAGLIVSILDLGQDEKTRRWPDITHEHDLMRFLREEKKTGGSKVRLCVVEIQNMPSSGVIEALGGELKLDPRFFNWCTKSRGHVFTPSQSHRAPFVKLEFGILDDSTPRVTDAERFKTLIYIQPDEEGDGWTGIVLINSHTRVDLSARIITDPPPFLSHLPPPTIRCPKSFRELFLDSFEFTSIPCAIASPFYAVSSLFRLNCFCWNQIITTIREEDHRINGISDTSFGHAEEIHRGLQIVGRGGSMAWPGRGDKPTQEVQEALEEDFKHLVEQTDLLWATRKKMASVQQKNAETKWTSLTNAFTYLFAPVTIISGIYGMNVSQISGDSSNPNLWQFFVAVGGLIVGVLLFLAILNWIQIHFQHKRTAGMKEVLELAVGKN